MPGRTISFIDEDELQMYKLYRDRLVQEDGLINHRMTWMVLSQAFLTAFWGAMATKYFDDKNPLTQFFEPMVFVCVIGFFLALSSKLSIRAAQDEITTLRDTYLDMFEFTPSSFDKSFGRELWNVFYWFIDFRFWPFNNQSVRHNITKQSRNADCLVNVIPGLTGSNSFHYTGHLLPKLMPVLLIGMWIYLLHKLSFFSILKGLVLS